MKFLLNCLLFFFNINLIYCVPNYYGCISDLAKSFQYCNTSLSMKQRVESLISELTLQEKISLIAADPDRQTCPIPTKAIDRIGLPEYMWLTETNTGVSARCLSKTQCATTFIGPIGLGASFNRTSWFLKGDVISTEIRGFSNHGGYRNSGPTYKVGVDGYGPNMNILRDPRFGRASELPGEDPYLTGEYAQYYVKGIQQEDSTKKYIKMIAFLKHFDAYSLETNRGHNVNLTFSQFDLFDTYLPAYATAFINGRASGAMCSYNSINNVPSCANNFLLNEMIRDKWNRPDALITTDCGAVSNLLGPPVYAKSKEEAAAYTIMNGTDIEAGSTIFSTSLANAIQMGLATTAAVDKSLYRALILLFKAGRFDPIDDQEFTNIPASAINSTYHQQIAFEAALQSFVLLKNDDDFLPLNVISGINIAIVGPQSNATYGLLSDYYGDEPCYGGNFDCIVSIYKAIKQYNINGVTNYEIGVDMNSTRTDGIASALDLVAKSDIVILALGIDKSIEHEGHDRPDITLPGLQEEFGEKVLALGKPTLLVLTNGGQIALSKSLIQQSKSIIEAFNPSVIGASALAATIFGEYNQFGKLPYTIYPADYVKQVDLFSFDMSKTPGRTYKYYTGQPLFPFGYGLSYSKFKLECVQQQPNGLNFLCSFQNVGNFDGDNILQVYHSVSDDIRKKYNHPFPIKKLIEFERVHISKQSSTKIQVNLEKDKLNLINADGDSVLYKGLHYLSFTDGNLKPIVFQIQI